MKKNKTIAVDNIRDLKDLNARKVLIGGGQLVFASMSANVAPPKGFVAQRPRDAARGFLSGFQKNLPKVYVYVNPMLFDWPKTRFGLAIDAYIAWGTGQRKGETVLIGGIERDEGSFTVDVLVFDSGRLVAIYDKELPDRQNVRFRGAAEAIVSKIKADYPKARIKQAAPLSDWTIEGVEYVDTKPLKHLSYRPLSRSLNSHRHLLVPAAIATAGVIFNFGIIGAAWNTYQDAQKRYEVAANDPEVKIAGGVDSEYINVITQRRMFMETARRQDVLPSKMLQIVRGIGVLPAVQIVELQLPAPSISSQPTSALIVSAEGNKNPDLITDDRVADAKMKISVPRTRDSALEQAKDVLATLRDSTGMSLRLTHRGWQEDNNRRIYTIEGFIHD